MIFTLHTTLIWRDTNVAQTYTNLSWDHSIGESFESYLGRVMDSILIASEGDDGLTEIKIAAIDIENNSDIQDKVNEAVSFLREKNIKYRLTNF